MIYSSVKDYANIIKVCDTYIDFFGAKAYVAKAPLQIYYYQKMICHTQLRFYKTALQTAEKCKHYLYPGTFNWFKYKELEFVLQMYLENYQEAYEICYEVKAHDRFEFLSENSSETWTVHGAYISYLALLGKITPRKSDRRCTKFRFGKFLNETPISFKDKSGANIAVRILKMLFLIHQRKHDEVIDEADALAKYHSRYVSKELQPREYYFIKMLLLIASSGFHKEGIIRKTEEYLSKIRRYAVDVTKPGSSLEVISYDHLWTMVLESLEDHPARAAG